MSQITIQPVVTRYKNTTRKKKNVRRTLSIQRENGNMLPVICYEVYVICYMVVVESSLVNKKHRDATLLKFCIPYN